jgi:uncharacterized protein (UPF0305 family)
MNKEEAIYFAGLMEFYLNIPSFVCENIEKKLIDENYKEVIEFIINRTKELKEKQKDTKYQMEIAYETINKQKEVLDKIKEYIKNTEELYLVENYEEEGLMTPIKNIKELLEEIE